MWPHVFDSLQVLFAAIRGFLGKLARPGWVVRRCVALLINIGLRLSRTALMPEFRSIPERCI
jgi:hypothetical protein